MFCALLKITFLTVQVIGAYDGIVRIMHSVVRHLVKLAVNQGPARLWRDSALWARAPASAPYIAVRTWLDGSHLANLKYHIFVIIMTITD